MNTSNFVIKLTIDNVSHIQIWNSDAPFFIGHPKKWKLSQSDAHVNVTDVAHEKIIESLNLAQLINEKTISLHDKVNDISYKIEIKLSNKLSPAFHNVGHVDEGQSVQVYHCRGMWTLEEKNIETKYFGTYHGKKIFLLEKVSGSNTFEIKSYTDGLIYEIDNQESELKRKEKKIVSLKDLSFVKIKYNKDYWAFKRVDPSVIPLIPPMVRLNNPETVLFHKSLKSAGVFFAAILLLSLIWPAHKNEKPEEAQVTTILLPKKKVVKGLMTAAPKGDPKRKDTSIGAHGVKKNSGRKGTVAQNKTKTVRKQQPKAVAKTQQRTNPVRVQQNAKGTARSAPKATAQAKKPQGPSSALQKAAQGLMGGKAPLLAKSRFGAGSDLRSEGESAARGQSGGSSLAKGTGGSIGGSQAGLMSAGSGSVSGFGGGSASGNGDGGPGSSGAGYGRGSHAKVSGQGRSFVSMDESASEVDSGLTKDQVGRVIHKHMNEIRYCYESSTVRNPNLGGRLSLSFNINAQGRVSRSSVARSTIGDSKLNNCIVSRLRNWQFPRPMGGVDVAVTYPFIFKTL